MEEKYIPTEPRKSMLMDGRGNTVMIVKALPGENKDGDEIVTFLIKVSEPVQATYGFKEKEDLDTQRNMKLIVKQIDLINMNPFDDSNRRWLYEKDLKHNPTEISKKSEYLKLQIEIERRKNSILECENLRLAEENHLFRTAPELMAARASELTEKTLKTAAEIFRPKEEYGKQNF